MHRMQGGVFSWMMLIFLLFSVCVCLELGHCFSIMCESILLAVDVPLLTFVVRSVHLVTIGINMAQERVLTFERFSNSPLASLFEVVTV